jgi:hypothetical protein
MGGGGAVERLDDALDEALDALEDALEEEATDETGLGDATDETGLGDATDDETGLGDATDDETGLGDATDDALDDAFEDATDDAFEDTTEGAFEDATDDAFEDATEGASDDARGESALVTGCETTERATEDAFEWVDETDGEGGRTGSGSGSGSNNTDNGAGAEAGGAVARRPFFRPPVAATSFTEASPGISSACAVPGRGLRKLSGGRMNPGSGKRGFVARPLRRGAAAVPRGGVVACSIKASMGAGSWFGGTKKLVDGPSDSSVIQRRCDYLNASFKRKGKR